MENINVDILPPVHRPGLVRRVAQPQEFGEKIAREVDVWQSQGRSLGRGGSLPHTLARGSNLPSSQGIGLAQEPLPRHVMESLQGIFGSHILPALGDKLASMDEAENAFWANQAVSSDPQPLQLVVGGTELLVQVAGLVLVRKDNSQHIFYGEPLHRVVRVLPVTLTGASLITLIMQHLPIPPSTLLAVDAAAFILAIGGVVLKE